MALSPVFTENSGATRKDKDKKQELKYSLVLAVRGKPLVWEH